MTKQIEHPGEALSRLLDDRNLSQRELASRLDIAHSLLSNILNCNRPINIKLAISLEAAGFDDANKWLIRQMEFDLHEAQKDKKLIQKQEEIKGLNEIENLVPISFLKKHLPTQSESGSSLQTIYDVYGANDISTLKQKVETYTFNNFRKSLKFKENRNNVVAWSYLAEYKAKLVNSKPFDPSKEDELIDRLKACFYENKKTISKTKSILEDYGIVFFTLDRPPQTPVDGKAFMSNENPSIVLSLKYNRLDNFAFNIMHELGHVFKHLTKSKYKNTTFFTNSPNVTREEFEADSYAKDNLISPEIWNDFVDQYDEFDDECILKFSKKARVHPAIIRGRICFENPDYYRKRTSINSINVLPESHI
ncbi:ImmA/IrrE family metallo-endopeptidase [Flavobacterium sp. LS1P28]|uniref:ImmA/IrrE family metallo-endopeptidase n=1 Tax=Flavobacterium sp. LS1P28 TaxID=2497752 RepID=UPI000F82ED22|nr:ImmA/IrrE family metallo-endopeptidase [Flavobacterium sp. LS1P28]RTY85397.1 ImmA/IrrE family metallo-endopeptidase [Flavobacterium sp. LS1P28]